MDVGYPYGKLKSRHKDRQMETKVSALLLTTERTLDEAPAFVYWARHLSACPFSHLVFGAAHEGKFGSPNQTFYPRLLPLIGPGWRGQKGDGIHIVYTLLIDQLPTVMEHKPSAVTHTSAESGQ